MIDRKVDRQEWTKFMARSVQYKDGSKFPKQNSVPTPRKDD